MSQDLDYANMATVISGGGIIGTATAYYLSENQEPSSIHIVESSPELFASASGYAGGFLAKDWFAAPVASLGALSFDLHKQLAISNQGAKKWGYAPSTALSLAVNDGLGMGREERGDDWLLEGTSRADMAAEEGDMLNGDGTPAWITKQKGYSLESISSEESCAQVEPLQLCQFLMSECKARGVQVHMPATPTKIITDSSSTINAITIKSSTTDEEIDLACASFILTAGAWTPRVFSHLFPDSSVKIPIEPLAGHSINVRSPRHTLVHEQKYGRCHAVFCAPSAQWSFAPEAISRTGGEIYVAGLNSSTLPLPEVATDTKTMIDPASIEELRSVTVQLAGGLAKAGDACNKENKKQLEDDLEIVRQGLCFRPAGRGGKPIIGRVADGTLGRGVKASDNGGVYVASGHGPWGISLSLGTGKVMAEMVQGKALSAQVDALAPR